MQVRWRWLRPLSSGAALPLQETLAPSLLQWTRVWGYLNLFLKGFVCAFVYLSSCLVLFKLFTMYHVHVMLSPRIMLVTGISFIRMSYSFVSCSVIYLLFRDWRNVRFLFWITFNYMSECLNYPDLTTLSSLVRRYRAGYGGGLEKDMSGSLCWSRGMRGTWWVFILHKLFAVSVFKTVRLHPDGVCDSRTECFSSSLWFVIGFWAEVL